MDVQVLAAFHTVSKLRRPDLFADDTLTPVQAIEDACTPAPGWVGPEWANGTLLVGINPGGGGDDYRRNRSDDELYGLLRAFAGAQSADEQSDNFARLSEAWLRLQRTHNIWRIIEPILAATGENAESSAFINILPFRTRMDKAAPVAVLRRAWELASRRQIEALQPRRVIALGKKAWDVLSRFTLPENSELILFKRGIGDSYIPTESQAVLRRLAEVRQTELNTGTRLR